MLKIEWEGILVNADGEIFWYGPKQNSMAYALEDAIVHCKELPDNKGIKMGAVAAERESEEGK